MRLVILIISALLIQIFGLLPIPTANAGSASYYFSPSSVNVSLGQTRTVTLYISTNQAVNSSSGTIVLPSSYISATSVSKSGSIFTLWTTNPSVSGSTIKFGGGLSSPGYNGGSGKILSFTIRGNSEGTGLINLNSGQILANDGKGTNIHSGAATSTVTVTRIVSGAAIASETHPDQSKWYSLADVKLSWSKPTGYRDYSYTMSKTGSDTISKSNITATNTEFTDLADGIWTFRLTTRYTDGKSATSSFTVNIDTTAPTKPKVKVKQESEKDQFPIFEISSTDKSSGIDYYEITIDNGDSIRATKSPFKLPKQTPGNHNYSVVAVDKAGNKSVEATGSFFIEGVPGPMITDYPAFVAMLQPIILKGTALYGSSVQLYIDGEQVAEFFVSEFLSEQQERKDGGYAADDEVEWSYTLKQSLPSGIKAIHATQTTSEGNDSFKSNIVNVRVLAGWISLGGIIIPIPVLFWITALLLILSGGFLFFYWRRTKKSWLKRLEKLQWIVDKDIDDYKKDSQDIKADIEQIKKEVDEDFEEAKK